MPRSKKRKKDPQPGPAATDAKRVSPVDIQQKEFRVAFRGYNEHDVDTFLDEVTEEVARLFAENKRLREELDIVVRRTSEEADLIGREARPQEALGPFIARERQFLQSLADLIQRHAEGVKEDLRRTRQTTATPRMSEPAPALDPPEPSTGAGPSRLVDGPGPTEDHPTRAWTEDATAQAAAPQDWTQYYVGPKGPAGGGRAGTAKVEEIVDLTKPAPAAPPQPADDGDEDRTIRELFWGED